MPKAQRAKSKNTKNAKQPKPQRVKDPVRKALTPKERKFVEHFQGNQMEAARKAGFQHPEKVASGIFNRPHVKAAIETKQAAFLRAVGKNEASRVRVTRNDIINRLDDLSKNAENDSTKVSALRELVDIFGMSSKNSDHDPFAGWSLEELEEFHRSGTWPSRYAAPPVDSADED